ncbi:predicted protein [Botrytis cinerea T4]|uniref:Uncharacterized protein n=1 Tax=Botryotinia fuckeliana (strain T4) TaxID=999810 RepID=G2Y8Y9_BOTF4|nr:predicted protein [Botrytis cinerea T4]
MGQYQAEDYNATDSAQVDHMSELTGGQTQWNEIPIDM